MQYKKMDETTATKVVTLNKERNEGDVGKVLEMVFETAAECAPQIIGNVARTMNKSSFTIKCEVGYNKSDEIVVKVFGSVSLPTETKEMEGEILEGKLRLW